MAVNDNGNIIILNQSLEKLKLKYALEEIGYFCMEAYDEEIPLEAMDIELGLDYLVALSNEIYRLRNELQENKKAKEKGLHS